MVIRKENAHYIYGADTEEEEEEDQEYFYD
jgi:hypothetical protein